MAHNDKITLRVATPDDASALLEIYAPYVLETAISFEQTVPSESAFRARMEGTLAAYPYLVAERSGEAIGYAYAGRFHSRKSYDLSAEASIYVRRDARGSGVGKALYTALESLCKAQNIQNLYACIAYADPEDAHLKNDSARFHAHMGYALTARFRRCACKFDTWYDMIWMEKALGDHPTPAPALHLFPQLEKTELYAALLGG